MSQQDSRRQLFKIALGISGLALLAPKSLFAEEKRRAKPGAAGGGDLALPLVEPGKGMAANMNYQHSQAGVKDAAMKVERQGVPFAGQYCNKCMLYSSVGKKDGAEVGKCTLFTGQLVKGEGWCSSWAKKA